jgi:hypothetical protein
MRRGKRNGNKVRKTNSSSAIPTPGLTDLQMAAYALKQKPVGTTNLGRLWRYTDTKQGPQICIRRQDYSFNFGWSAAGSVSDQDIGSATDTGATVTDALTPITPVAEAFAYEFWPLMNAILQSGTGTRYTTTLYEVVRYFAITMECVQLVTFPLVVNYLINHFDWRAIAPYENCEPPAIWALADLLYANDTGIADVWRPLYERVATKVLPPEMVGFMWNQCSPYCNNLNGHILNLTCHYQGTSLLVTETLSTYIAAIVTYLDYLENDLKQCHNVLASFFPWRVGRPIIMYRGFNHVDAEIDFNSSTKAYDAFGDTTDPDEEKAIVFGTAATNEQSISFAHQGGSPTIEAVVNTAVWELTSDVDDTFIIQSFSTKNKQYFIDDALNLLGYDGTPSTNEAARFLPMEPSRYQLENGTTAVIEGKGQPGMLWAIIASDELKRVVREYTKYMFGYNTLQNVLQVSGGSAVRTMTKLVADVWAGRVR